MKILALVLLLVASVLSSNTFKTGHGLKERATSVKDIKQQTNRQEGDDLLPPRTQPVIGGKNVKDGAWPWLVSLQAKIPKLTLFNVAVTFDMLYCGSTLIAPRWLLTAAHCFKHSKTGHKPMDPKIWHARLGDVDLRPTTGEKLKGFFGKVFNRKDWRDWTVHIDQIILHPGYNESNMFANDIALVHLVDDVPHGPEVPQIQIVRLPVAGLMAFPDPTNECIAKGWGCAQGGGTVSEKAKQVSMPAMDPARCRHLWGIETTSRICAGFISQHKGICHGDSGGPLVCRHGDTWLQVGVASFGHGDAPGDYPGVFTRVSHYIGWIYDTMTQRG